MYCGMPKGTSRDEVTSNSENIELRLSESIRQVVGQSVEIPLQFFCSYLLEVFTVILKSLLGLVIPTKAPGWYCEAGYWVIFWPEKPKLP